MLNRVLLTCSNAAYTMFYKKEKNALTIEVEIERKIGIEIKHKLKKK